MPSHITRLNTVILALIIFHISALLYWNFYWSLDYRDDSGAYSLYSYYLEPTGLWQNWDVFAPPPVSEKHIMIQAIAGNITFNYTPEYQFSSRRFSYEKERKWHENMIGNDFASFRQVYLEYWCRRFEALHGEIDYAALVVYSEPIPAFGAGRMPKHEERRWDVSC